MKKTGEVDLIINAGTADNKLLHDKIISKLSSFKFDNSSYLSYSSTIGLLDFRKTMLFLMQLNTKRQLKVDNIATSAGASSAIINLLPVICKEGEGVMVPTPCYGGFPEFIEENAKCKFIPVNSYSRNDFKLTYKDLEDVYNQEISSGQSITCIIITNPDNPLGRLVNKNTLLDYLIFAKKYKLNIIVDEIYSNSIIDGEFISILDIIDHYFGNENDIKFFKDHIFLINGPSKDFGMNGFRAGYLYTENRDVFLEFADKNVRSTPSTFVQSALNYLFNDKEWVYEYVREYKALLRYYNKKFTDHLDMFKIPYVKADSGIFICLDLRKYMKELTFEEEDRLARHLTYNHFLYINTGKSMYFKEPGFFRVVYTDKKDFDNIIYRLKEGLDAYK